MISAHNEMRRFVTTGRETVHMKDRKEKINTFCCSDKGNYKSVNQDSLGYRIASVGEKDAAIFVLCDGLGGLSYGEVASGTVVTHVLDLFRKLVDGNRPDVCREDFTDIYTGLFRDLNEIIRVYGQKNHVQMGTTASVLILFDHRYFIIHIGDTRIYLYHHTLKQLTEDHSLVAMEVRKGILSKEQALTDSRRNVLTQCIGVNEKIEPYEEKGTYRDGDWFLLCSDGFRHVLKEREIASAIRECQDKTEEDIQMLLASLVKINMDRGEKDNISAMLVRT